MPRQFVRVFALTACLWAASAAAQQHRLVVQVDVPTLPGKAADLAALPGPLAALDPEKDLDPALLSAAAYQRAMDQARRRLAAEMTRVLTSEPRWAVSSINWPRTAAAKDAGKVSVTALFERGPVRQSSADRVAGQTAILRLFGKVPVIVAYRLDSKSLTKAPAELVDPIEAEVRRGDWSVISVPDCKAADDPPAIAKRAGKEADLMLVISAADKEPSEFGGFFRTEGSASAEVWRRNGERWARLHRSVLLDSKQSATILPDAPAQSREGAARDLHKIIGRDLVERGVVHDLCCRAFAGRFGAR